MSASLSHSTAPGATGDSSEGAKPFFCLFVFFSTIFQVSHSARKYLQTVQSSHQSYKAQGQVEVCMARVALSSRYMMSWMANKGVVECSVHVMGSLGMQGTMEMKAPLVLFLYAPVTPFLL